MRVRRFIRLPMLLATVALATVAVATVALGQTSAVSAQSGGVCDRQNAVQHAILEALPDTSDCSEVTDDMLRGIGGALDLSGQELATIAATDLAKLAGVTSIDLSDNQLSSVPADLFGQISHTWQTRHTGSTYHHQDNCKTYYTYYVTHTATAAATNVDLSSNQLTEIPAGLWSGLPDLKTVAISDNALEAVPEELPAALTSIDLSGNRIQELPDGAFNKFASLNTLKLQGNPGAPFKFIVNVGQRDIATMTIELSQDAPFPVSATLAAEHAVLDRTTVSIARASEDGGIVAVQPDVDLATEVRVRVASAEFSSGAMSGIAAVPGPALPPVFPQVLTMATDAKKSAEGMPVTVTISADHAAEHDTTASYTVVTDEDQATPDAGPADYADQGNGAVTIPAGETTADIIINIHDDDDAGDAHGEVFVVSLTPNGDAYWIGAESHTAVTIQTGICDRTPAVQDSLMAQLPDRANCGQVTQDDLQGITGGVNVRDRELTSLMAHDFRNLTKMAALAINANLASLPSGIFDDLSALTALDLDGNAFTGLPDAVPSNIRDLDMSGNRITSLPDGALSRYAELQSLDLRDNPGSPFLYTVNVRQAQDDLRVVIVQAERPMPFPTDVTLSATATSLSKTQFEVARDAQDGGTTIITADDWDRTDEIRIQVSEASFRKGENLHGIEPAAGAEISVQFPTMISLSTNAVWASQGDTITIIATATPTPTEDLTVRYVFGTGEDVMPDGTATGTIDPKSYTDLNDEQVKIPANTNTGQFQIRIDRADEEPKNLYVMVNNRMNGTNPYMGHPDAGEVRMVVRQDNEGADSNSQPEPEPANPPDTPEAPTGTVSNPGSGSIALDWNDVALATGYQVALWSHPDLVPLPSNDHPEIQVVYNGSSATVTGLPTGWSHYWFRVRASNSAGASDWSGWSNTANQ